MNINGTCHCGTVTYKAEIDPEMVIACHCNDCQVYSSSPFRINIRCEADKITFTGPIKEYVKIADSGNKRAMGFCGDCGTSIYSVNNEEPRALYALRAGSVIERNQLPPIIEIWTKESPDWAPALNCKISKADQG